MILSGENGITQIKIYALPLCPPQIPLNWSDTSIMNVGSRDERPATNCLRRGTAPRNIEIEVQKYVYVVLPLILFVVGLYVSEEHRLKSLRIGCKEIMEAKFRPACQVVGISLCQLRTKFYSISCSQG
jgi:hypothetical protein